AGLALAYAQAQGLVFASQAEGFGLPLVEALHHGLPVFASDLPVLREVAGPHARYFPRGDAAALAELLAAHVQAGAPRSAAAVAWPDWEQSTGEFLERVGEVLGAGAGARARMEEAR
ncbi:MAG TPA: glycosyltransferase, partial [bacterium]|nr:glycosyltransferase [bacterium]